MIRGGPARKIRATRVSVCAEMASLYTDRTPERLGSGCSKNRHPHKKNHPDTRSDLAYTGLGTHTTRACTRFPVETAESTAALRWSRYWVVTGPSVGTLGATVRILHPNFLVEVVDKGHGRRPVSTNRGQPHSSGPYSAGSVDHQNLDIRMKCSVG